MSKNQKKNLSPEADTAAEEEFTTLTPEGEDRRPQTDKSYTKGRSENVVDLSAMAQAEDELYRLKKEQGLLEQERGVKRLINRYYEWKDHRTLHLVNKKIYLLLNFFLGWCGIHRFYERRWGLGLFYLALCWTGFPAMMCAVDFMGVMFKEKDENGRILI